MTYFLSEMDRHRFEQRAQWSGVAEDIKPGHFRLFNKNADITFHVRIGEQDLTRYGWYVHSDVEPPVYFKNVLIPV